VTKPAKILVVDDDESMQKAIVDVLRSEGFQVLTAEHGLDALGVLEGHMPDLIIADIMMPKMNGYQLYQRISSNPDWTMIPFIFLSAKREGEDIRFGKELGVDDYLRKPVAQQDLISAVRGKLKRFNRLEGAHVRQSDQETHPTVAFGEAHNLTPKELEVLLFMVRGLTNDQIASELVVSPTTVKSHVSNILSKLQAKNRVEVVALALGQSKSDFLS
jgi:DNA-binding NarL/FixJ family response regulator